MPALTIDAADLSRGLEILADAAKTVTSEPLHSGLARSVAAA
jgi:hypothetical protein